MHKQQAAKLFHYQETVNEYYHFLLLLLDALDIYENKMKKRLTSRSVFYDVDCVVLYLKRVEEIRLYKRYLLSEAEYFIDAGKENFKVISDRINNSKDHYVNVFKDSYLTADGNCYKFNEFGPNITPILTMQALKSEQKVRHIKEQISLYPKDNKKSPIKDEVYQNNLPLFVFVSMSVPLAIVLFFAALTAVVIGAFAPSEIVKMLLFIGAAILTSVSLMLFILHFAWKNALKKKYYNGTNPFIFK